MSNSITLHSNAMYFLSPHFLNLISSKLKIPPPGLSAFRLPNLTCPVVVKVELKSR